MQTTVFKKITDVFLSFQVIKAIYLLNHNVWAKKYERKKNDPYEMGTEYFGLRYKTLARTGGFAA